MSIEAMSRKAARARTETMLETRDALIDAGLAEFAERGLDVPSLDAICARAGFTRGAFYVHFRGREDFLEAVMDKVFGAFLDAIIATGDDARGLEDTIDRFVAAVDAASSTGPRLPALEINIHRVLDACARSEALRQRFVALMLGGTERLTAVIKRGQQGGAIRRDVDAAALGHVLVMLALGFLTGADTGVPINAVPARRVALQLLSATPPRR